jgi:hypothetical protein
MIVSKSYDTVAKALNTQTSEEPPTPDSLDSLEAVMFKAGLKHLQQELRVAKAQARPRSLDECAAAYHVSKWVVANLVKRHELPTERVGKSIVLDIAELQPYLGRLPE